MGTFGGHILPGSFFIIFAVWWTIQIYRRLYRTSRRGALPFRSSITFPFDFLCGRLRNWEWEGFVKIFFTLVGFIGEIVTAHVNGRFVHLGNGQHATMFFFFGLSGAIDIMVHHRVPLPRGIEYVMAILAFVVETILFMFHLHGRNSLDTLLHTLLVYVLYSTVVVAIVEMKYRQSFMVIWIRTYLVFLQGTWFWQVGFILYNPIPGAAKWDGEDHEQIMVATMMFTWHMAAIVIIMLTIGLGVRLVTRWCADQEVGPYEVLDIQCLNTTTGRPNGKTVPNGKTAITNVDFHDEFSDDSDDNVDFVKPVINSH